jgi:hypothetical protein
MNSGRCAATLEGGAAKLGGGTTRIGECDEDATAGCGGSLASAADHLYLWSHVFWHAHVLGPAFMVNAVGGTAVAVLLVAWRPWVPPALAVGFGVATLGAFTITATAGLYGVHEHGTTWEGWPAAAAEVVVIVAAGTLLFREYPLSAGHRLQHPVPSP